MWKWYVDHKILWVRIKALQAVLNWQKPYKLGCPLELLSGHFTHAISCNCFLVSFFAAGGDQKSCFSYSEQKARKDMSLWLHNLNKSVWCWCKSVRFPFSATNIRNYHLRHFYHNKHCVLRHTTRTKFLCENESSWVELDSINLNYSN